ncbi:MAG: hypothetical protein FWC26_08295 [Fibromonadales bacterium]|nr:hypothetical protein [Fibromonadales bacterium]
MFAVKGVYDGKSIVTEEPVPLAESYAVAITFLYPVEKKQQSENVVENIRKFREKYSKSSLVKHLKKSLAEGKNIGFNVQEVIDGNESEENKQTRHKLEQNAWAAHVADNGAKWKT